MPAAEITLGRPRKYKDEKTKQLGLKVPESLVDDLKTKGPTAGAGLWEAMIFEHGLTQMLEPNITDLRVSAAMVGQSYELHRIETIARLVRLGLLAEKKLKKS